MKGDFSRKTFREEKHYSSVNMQQGRVQLDADWNEQMDITSHSIRSFIQDFVEKCGAPINNAGFEILHSSGNDYEIKAGHYYVDGILCENEAKNVIAMAFEMNEHGIAASPNCLAAAATGVGYSKMAFTASCLAEFIRNLGYKAISPGNDIALSIPLAIDAGLGQLGRNGLLITSEYGPRVRL